MARPPAYDTSSQCSDNEDELLVLPSLADVAGGFLMIVAFLTIAAILI